MSEIPQSVRTAILKQQERIFLLHLEKDLIGFITRKHKNKKEAQHIIQAMYLKNSYYRLLSHQLCQYYNLQHWNNTSNEIIVSFEEDFSYDIFLKKVDGDNEQFMRLSEYIQLQAVTGEVAKPAVKPRMLMKKKSNQEPSESEAIINSKLVSLSIDDLNNIESQRANKEALYMKIREKIFDQQTHEDEEDQDDEEDEERSSGGDNGSADTSESSIDDFYRNQHLNGGMQQQFPSHAPPPPPPHHGYNYPVDPNVYNSPVPMDPNIYNTSIPMGFPSPGLQYPFNYNPHYPPVPPFQGPPISPSPSQHQPSTGGGTVPMPPPVMFPYVVSSPASFAPLGVPPIVPLHGRYKNNNYNNKNHDRRYSYDKELERKILNNPYIILPDNNTKHKKQHYKRRYQNNNNSNNYYSQNSSDYSASSTK